MRKLIKRVKKIVSKYTSKVEASFLPSKTVDNHEIEKDCSSEDLDSDVDGNGDCVQKFP